MAEAGIGPLLHERHDHLIQPHSIPSIILATHSGRRIASFVLPAVRRSSEAGSSPEAFARLTN